MIKKRQIVEILPASYQPSRDEVEEVIRLDAV